MPNRIIKETICSNEQIDQLSAFEETFFYRLIVNADDFGRFDGRPAILRARLFPLKAIRDDQIVKALAALSSVELVNTYYVDGKPFVRLTGWERNQQIRATKSKYPPESDADDENEPLQDIDITCNQLISDDSNCSRNRIRNPNRNPNPNPNRIRDRESDHEKRKRFVPPTVDDVQAFITENGLTGVDPQRFVDFYASKGWKVGSSPMKDWKAACRGWNRRSMGGGDYGPSPTGGKPSPAKPNPALDYEQRSYSKDDYGDDFFIDLSKEYDNGGA